MAEKQSAGHNITQELDESLHILQSILSEFGEGLSHEQFEILQGRIDKIVSNLKQSRESMLDLFKQLINETKLWLVRAEGEVKLQAENTRLQNRIREIEGGNI